MAGAKAEIEATYTRTGSLIAGTAGTSCEGFVIRLMLDSPDEAERVAEVARLAHRSCFTESTLEAPVAVRRTTVINGRTLEGEAEGQGRG
jgi:hypothetical protein